MVDFESLSARSFELLYRRFLTLSRIDTGFVVTFADPVVEVTKDVVDVGESVGGVAVERERRRGGVANSWSRLKLTWLPGICKELISEVAVNTPCMENVGFELCMCHVLHSNLLNDRP